MRADGQTRRMCPAPPQLSHRISTAAWSSESYMANASNPPTRPSESAPSETTSHNSSSLRRPQSVVVVVPREYASLPTEPSERAPGSVAAFAKSGNVLVGETGRGTYVSEDPATRPWSRVAGAIDVARPASRVLRVEAAARVWAARVWNPGNREFTAFSHRV